jgi:hypothetical protein
MGRVSQRVGVGVEKEKRDGNAEVTEGRTQRAQRRESRRNP